MSDRTSNSTMNDVHGPSRASVNAIDGRVVEELFGEAGPPVHPGEDATLCGHVVLEPRDRTTRCGPSGRFACAATPDGTDRTTPARSRSCSGPWVTVNPCRRRMQGSSASPPGAVFRLRREPGVSRRDRPPNERLSDQQGVRGLPPDPEHGVRRRRRIRDIPGIRMVRQHGRRRRSESMTRSWRRAVSSAGFGRSGFRTTMRAARWTRSRSSSSIATATARSGPGCSPRMDIRPGAVQSSPFAESERGGHGFRRGYVSKGKASTSELGLNLSAPLERR